MAEETSWLKSITGGVIGAGALTLIKEYVEKQGGIDAVVKNFQNAGFSGRSTRGFRPARTR
ncbi:hypothetical protein [Methylocystis echinoides]|uniref:hypothetical protein n=1 Tax=Methylocystis echinoides TaxID=29468 RepID=UPI002490E350|nr:hypothetical protein [Methylocystis echinoides]